MPNFALGRGEREPFDIDQMLQQEVDLDSGSQGARFGGTPLPPRWRKPLIIVIVVVLLGGGYLGYRALAASQPNYQGALVRYGNVLTQVHAIATIAPTSQSNVNFGVSGTVSAVNVTVGQSVSAGATLATLNTSSIQSTILSDTAALDAAQAKLASDEAAQARANTQNTTGQPTSIATLQGTLTQDQAAEDQALTSVQNAITQANSLCVTTGTNATSQGVSAPNTTDATPTSTTSSQSPTRSPSQSSQTPTSSSQTPTSCAQALSVAAGDQSAASNAATKVQNDTKALTNQLSSSSSSASQGGFNTSSSGSTHTVTASQIALDQANIDVAQAKLTAANQQLANATLVAPISGTIAAVSLADGASVGGNSSASSPEVVIIGGGSTFQASLDVPVTQIGEIKPGQPATLLPDSSLRKVSGTVTSVGTVPTTSNGSTDYPVTIGFSSKTLGGFSGVQAQATITVARVSHVLTVPTSAVTTTGSIHDVTLLRSSHSAQVHKVTLGAVGDILTQISSGLRLGESVALANLSEPVPASNTSAIFSARTLVGGGALRRIAVLRGGA